jgi:3-oxoacyl-[acyl-carrier protein] reductase
MSALDLTGRVALVCGASKGIGRASCVALAERGATVIAMARSQEPLVELTSTLSTAAGQHHVAYIADINTVDKTVDGLLTYVEDHGAIHIVVNNTAGPTAGQLQNAQRDELVNAFTQHVLASHALMQALIPGMKSTGWGRLINIISTSVKQPIEGLGVSNTIRGAMNSWAKTLSVELAPFGITVNNVLPGATRTERLDAIIARKAAQSGKSAEEVEREMVAEIPAGRFAGAEEIAFAVAMLAAPGAAYITGQSIAVDGGRTRAF